MTLQCVTASQRKFTLFSLMLVLCFPLPAAAQDQPAAVGTPEAGQEEKPQPKMVFIPGGEFLMGDEGFIDTTPHLVRVSPFSMDATEVTNAQYLAFCETTGHRPPEFWGMDVFRSGPAFPDHPVVGISWSDAEDYAKWRGARLPTEAEWEFAARGGRTDWKYALGNEKTDDLYAPGGSVSTAGPSPVASYRPNEYGLYDMTGNVSEWVFDRYSQDYFQDSPNLNPRGAATGKFRVIRGGGWHTGPGCSMVYYRMALKSNWLDFNVGFRCVRSEGGSAAEEMAGALAEGSLADALALYWSMRRSAPGTWYFDEIEFNNLGYAMLTSDRLIEAVEILRLNVEAHPASFNAWDSLGEAYADLGNRELAAQAYRKALSIHPRNRPSLDGLEKLGVSP